MTALLKKYYELEAEYKTEPAETFEELKAKSAELNKKQAVLLSKMNVSELTYLLDNTTGYMRSVLADYLKKAKERKPAKKTSKPYDELAAAIG